MDKCAVQDDVASARAPPSYLYSDAVSRMHGTANRSNDRLEVRYHTGCDIRIDGSHEQLEPTK